MTTVPKNKKNVISANDFYHSPTTRPTYFEWFDYHVTSSLLKTRAFLAFRTVESTKLQITYQILSNLLTVIGQQSSKHTVPRRKRESRAHYEKGRLCEWKSKNGIHGVETQSHYVSNTHVLNPNQARYDIATRWQQLHNEGRTNRWYRKHLKHHTLLISNKK